MAGQVGASMLETAEALVFRAKVADQTMCYDDMIAAVNQLAGLVDRELVYDERNLLSVAYKNVVGSRRASWRLVSSVINTEKNKSKLDVCLGIRQNIESDIRNLCNEVIQLMDSSCIPKATSPEGKVFFLKMKADHLRYLAEISPPRNIFVTQTSSTYIEATEQAQELDACHSLRLALALNFSVFKYEIQNSSDEACGIAKRAFDAAIAVRDEGKKGKDSIMILAIIRENLTLWTSETEGAT